MAKVCGLECEGGGEGSGEVKWRRRKGEGCDGKEREREEQRASDFVGECRLRAWGRG